MSCRACTQSVLSIFIREVAGIHFHAAPRTAAITPRTLLSPALRRTAIQRLTSKYSTAAAVHVPRDDPPTEALAAAVKVPQDHPPTEVVAAAVQDPLDDPPPEVLVAGVQDEYPIEVMATAVIGQPGLPPVSVTANLDKHAEGVKPGAQKKMSREKSHKYRLSQWKKETTAVEHEAPRPARNARHAERLQRWKQQVQHEQGDMSQVDAPLPKDLPKAKPNVLPKALPKASASPDASCKAVQKRSMSKSAPLAKTNIPHATPSGSIKKAGLTTDRDWRKNENPQLWQGQKAAVTSKLQGAAWAPFRKLSPDALEGIRALNLQYPDQFPTPVLAEHFKISPEAIRRILKSKWRPSGEEAEDRRERWERRGAKIWEKLVETGQHAPRKWREKGIGAGGPRRGRREWLAGVKEKYRIQGREPPPSRFSMSGSGEKAPVIATKWEGHGDMGPRVGTDTI